MDQGVEIKVQATQRWRSIGATLALMFVYFFSSGPAAAQTNQPPPGIPACTSPCSSLYACNALPGDLAPPPSCVGIHRLYSPGAGRHLYASDPNEMATLTQNGGYELQSLYNFSTCYNFSFTAGCDGYPNVFFRHLYRCHNETLQTDYLTITPPY